MAFRKSNAGALRQSFTGVVLSQYCRANFRKPATKFRSYHTGVRHLLYSRLPFYSLFRRTLFPRKPELVDELMERTGIDSTLRPHQVDFKDYNKICQSFLELARDHELSVTPLRVRKPVAIATASNKVEQSDVTDDDVEVNFKNSIRHWVLTCVLQIIKCSSYL